MDYIRELEIIKTALEGDIIRQKNSDKATEPAFKAWLEDSEKVLKKVNKKIMTEKTKERYLRK